MMWWHQFSKCVTGKLQSGKQLPSFGREHSQICILHAGLGERPCFQRFKGSPI